MFSATYQLCSLCFAFAEVCKNRKQFWGDKTNFCSHYFIFAEVCKKQEAVLGRQNQLCSHYSTFSELCKNRRQFWGDKTKKIRTLLYFCRAGSSSGTTKPTLQRQFYFCRARRKSEAISIQQQQNTLLPITLLLQELCNTAGTFSATKPKVARRFK